LVVRDLDVTASSMLLGVAALLAASTLASRYPVPIEGPNSGGVSLSFVFAASAIVLFGWAAGVIVAFAAPVLIQLTEHRPIIRIGYNGSVFAAAAAVGGGLVTLIHGDGTAALISKGRRLSLDPVRNQSGSHLARGGRYLPAAVLRADRSSLALDDHRLRADGVGRADAGRLWQRSPLLSAALVGPLLAIALYQRSTYRALRAMKLALTDPADRARQPQALSRPLERELIEAERNQCSFSLCLVDVDDFKRVNDLFGTLPATACSPGSRRPCARTARRSGSVATSLRCCSRRTTRARP
jgi:predicted signal transduction protein with EAL and GGDEF domain